MSAVILQVFPDGGEAEAALESAVPIRYPTTCLVKNLNSVMAVILPVSLGLGLIYLYGVGRIGALAAIAALIGGGVLLVVVVVLAEIAAHEPVRTTRKGRPVRL